MLPYLGMSTSCYQKSNRTKHLNKSEENNRDRYSRIKDTKLILTGEKLLATCTAVPDMMVRVHVCVLLYALTTERNVGVTQGEPC